MIESVGYFTPIYPIYRLYIPIYPIDPNFQQDIQVAISIRFLLLSWNCSACCDCSSIRKFTTHTHTPFNLDDLYPIGSLFLEELLAFGFKFRIQYSCFKWVNTTKSQRGSHGNIYIYIDITLCLISCCCLSPFSSFVLRSTGCTLKLHNIALELNRTPEGNCRNRPPTNWCKLFSFKEGNRGHYITNPNKKSNFYKGKLVQNHHPDTLPETNISPEKLASQ